MVKRSKLLAVLIAGIIATTSLVGCGGKDEKGGTANTEKKTLTVWSHFTTNEVKEFEKVAKAWGEENNVEVSVVEDQGKFQEMIQACQSDNGPDLILGVPHDNLGTFQKAGITADDVITFFDGKRVRDIDKQDLATYISEKKPGDKVKITYWRNKKEKEVSITLTSQQ